MMLDDVGSNLFGSKFSSNNRPTVLDALFCIHLNTLLDDAGLKKIGLNSSNTACRSSNVGNCCICLNVHLTYDELDQLLSTNIVSSCLAILDIKTK